MKKIIFSLIVFIMLPLTCLAADYDIKNYYIDAYIKENGDLDITELIVMKGTFNGFAVGIPYNTNNKYSASRMSNVSIAGKTNVKNVSWETLNEEMTPFIKVNIANDGDSLKYTERINNYENNYRMYYKTKNSTTAFLFKYTLEDVALLHNDVVEIYWNFFSEAFNDEIKDLQIRVHLPKNIDKDSFNYWFHGPLTGSSDYYDGFIIADAGNVPANSPVDFRILLPKEMFSNISKVFNNNVREEIIIREDEIVQQDLAKIKEIRIIYYSTVILSITFYIILVLVWIRAYKKFDKERKPKFQNKYNREFIDDYNVEVIDYLMNQTVTPNAMSASIMNLIYKKNIKYEEIEKGKKKKYKFILLNKDNLNDTENKLVDFLFDTVGKNNEFTTDELKSYASSTKTCNKFMNSYTAWKNQVIADGEKEEFFEKKSNRGVSGIIMFLFALLICGFAGMNNVEFVFAYMTVFAAIIFLFYLTVLSKKTEKGIEHYAKWNAFKNFLNDFGTFELKELPEIVLWERYLVYAIIFGLADKVEKAMNVRISEIDVSEMNSGIYIMPYIHIAPVINSSINSAFNGAQTAINRNTANSVGGSLGGHGGGFSSGGGFGGGGRSGGGF